MKKTNLTLNKIHKADMAIWIVTTTMICISLGIQTYFNIKYNGMYLPPIADRMMHFSVLIATAVLFLAAVAQIYLTSLMKNCAKEEARAEILAENNQTEKTE